MCARYLITQNLPIDEGEKLARIYVKIYKEFPSYVKVIGKSPYITTSDNQITVITVIEIENEITGEGLKDVYNYFNKFNKIEDHDWKIQTVLNRKEALRMMGQSID